MYPALEKTWQFDVGRDLGAGSYRMITRGIKNAWKDFPLNPPIIKGSSDGLGAGMDGIDRWLDDEDIVGTTSQSGARSWIVIRTAAGCELLIDTVNIWASGDVTHYTCYFSGSAGFTGGTTHSRPTAMDEVVAAGSLLAPDAWFAIASAAGAWFSPVKATRLQMLHSTDGRETRIVLTGDLDTPEAPARYLISWSVGEVAEPPPVSVTNPAGFVPKYWMLDSFFYPGARSLYNLQVDPRGCMIGMPGFGTRGKLYLESVALGPPQGNYTTTVPTSVNNAWPMVPLRLYQDVPGQITRVGRIKDTWGGSEVNPAGTTFQDGGVKKFAQFGSLILPWNDTDPVVY